MASEKEEVEVGAISLSSMLEKKINPEDGATELEQTQESLKAALGGNITPPNVEEGVNNTDATAGEPGEENDPPNPGNKKKEDEEEIEVITSNYSEILKDILGESFENISIEGEEGEEPIPLSEIAEMDPETFKEVIANHISNVKKQSEKDKISLESVSEFTKALIEIERNGGNISSLLKERMDFGDPLEKLDLKTDAGLKEAIRLRLVASGQSADQINRLIKSYETDGVLEEYGNAAYDELKTALDQRAKDALERSRIEAEEREKDEKNFKKEIKDNLSTFELKDSIKNKIADLATQRNENGQYVMDRLYIEHRSDSIKAAEMAFFLLDREEFIKQITNKAVNTSKLNSAQQRVIVRKPPVSAGGEKQKTENKVVSITELENR